jgi:nucleoside-diphosphate-sugar epimerase
MAWQAAHGMPIAVHRGTERCLTWAGDTVRGMVMILESGQAGTWNVSRDDDHWPVADLAARIAAVAGGTSEITVQDPPPRVTARKHLSNTRLLGLGWKPATELGEGIERCLDHYRRYDTEGRWRG